MNECKNCDEKQCGLHIVMSQVRDANLKILERRPSQICQEISSGADTGPRAYAADLILSRLMNLFRHTRTATD